MTYRFASYGLIVESTMAVPGVMPAPPGLRPDVVVRLAQSDHAAIDGGAGEIIRYASPERDEHDTPWMTVYDGAAHRFVYSEGAQFLISRDGTAVEGAWRAPLTESDAASYLLGPVLAFVLRLRGVVPLHAGAVVVRGGAFVFAGPAGAGKSSTVAAFGALGYDVLSDDVVPIRVRANDVCADPGFPRVSVWDDTASAVLGPGMSALRPWSETYGKRCLDLDDRGFRFCERSVPVTSIFILGPRSDRGVPAAPFKPRAAVLALAANTYGSYLLDPRLREVEFALLASVAGRVPVHPLHFDDDLGRLLEGCAALAAP
jgi:hypothetical protein